MKTIRVWDLPIRIFHWTLVLLISAAFITEKIGGNAMVWHFRIGYCILTLLLFRIVWGFIGARTARFASFIFSPRIIFSYLRDARKNTFHKNNSHRYSGHNPLGGLSVLAMLTLLLAQALSGLFADDEISNAGPLVSWIAREWSAYLTQWHVWNSNILLGLIGLHVTAIAYYKWVKHIPLTRAMFTGEQECDETDVGMNTELQDSYRMRWLALTLVLALAGLVGYIVNLN